jgi:hypothetical protein
LPFAGDEEFSLSRGGHARDVDFLMFILIEVPLDELFEITEAHLPSLGLLHFHLVKSTLSESVFDMFLESVVEEGASAQTSGSYSRLLDLEGLQGYDFVGN